MTPSDVQVRNSNQGLEWGNPNRPGLNHSYFLGKWGLSGSNHWIIRAQSFSCGLLKIHPVLENSGLFPCTHIFPLPMQMSLIQARMSNADYYCYARMHVIYIPSCEIDTHDPACEASVQCSATFKMKRLPGLCATSDLLRSHAVLLAWN